jgi:hypothetical protein
VPANSAMKRSGFARRLALVASPLCAEGDLILANQVCASNDSIFVGPCRSFRARLVPGADNIRIRIWPVGSSRLLGYTDGALKCRLPPMLKHLMDEGKTVYADVSVRPVTLSQPGHMQFACVASAEHMKAQDALQLSRLMARGSFPT